MEGVLYFMLRLPYTISNHINMILDDVIAQARIVRLCFWTPTQKSGNINATGYELGLCMKAIVGLYKYKRKIHTPTSCNIGPYS